MISSIPFVCHTRSLEIQIGGGRHKRTRLHLVVGTVRYIKEFPFLVAAAFDVLLAASIVLQRLAA